MAGTLTETDDVVQKIEKISENLENLKVKKKSDDEFTTDFAPDRFVRWFSSGIPLFFAFTLQGNSLLSAGDVSCLPEHGLLNYSSTYSLPFANNVDKYCGTLMKEIDDSGKEIQLYQHYFPHCLLLQAMLSALPYILWYLLVVDDIKANLQFIKDDMEQGCKNNFAIVRSYLNESDKSGREILSTWCQNWLSSKQNIYLCYAIFLKLFPLLIQLAFIAFYFSVWDHYDINTSQVKFKCSVEGKMTVVCILLNGNLIYLLFWANISSIFVNFAVTLVHGIMLGIKSNQGKEDVMSDFFYCIGMERPKQDQASNEPVQNQIPLQNPGQVSERNQTKSKPSCSQSYGLTDYDFMSTLSYRNISKMKDYHNYLVSVKRFRAETANISTPSASVSG